MKQMMKGLADMRRNIRMAWISNAAKILPPTSKIVMLMPNHLDAVILRVLAEGDYLGDDREAILELLTAAEGKAGPAKTQSLEIARESEAARLRDIFDRSTATALYDVALKFAKEHRLKEPTNEKIEKFLSGLDVDLRHGLGIQDSAKYAGERRANNWKLDVSKAFTVSFLAFRAWNPE